MFWEQLWAISHADQVSARFNSVSSRAKTCHALCIWGPKHRAANLKDSQSASSKTACGLQHWTAWSQPDIDMAWTASSALSTCRTDQGSGIWSHPWWKAGAPCSRISQSIASLISRLPFGKKNALETKWKEPPVPSNTPLHANPCDGCLSRLPHQQLCLKTAVRPMSMLFGHTCCGAMAATRFARHHRTTVHCKTEVRWQRSLWNGRGVERFCHWWCAPCIAVWSSVFWARKENSKHMNTR